jgi:SAM-dependent methyltransferase
VPRPPERTESFGQSSAPSAADRLGRWLSTARIRRAIGPRAKGRTADIGCGYDARLGRDLFAAASFRLFVDLSVDPAFADERTSVVEGRLPEVLGTVADGSIDAVVCNNVIEHLWEPDATLAELRRITANGGVCVVNVPSWLGKSALELAAFRLGMSPADEMNDHKHYFDPRDLWPRLVRAGFKPSSITVRRHKLRLNTIAVCRVP